MFGLVTSRGSSALGYFSGKYIDVDFRVDRGHIHSSKKTKRHNSKNRVISVIFTFLFTVFAHAYTYIRTRVCARAH